jgi:hypothetical protein
MTAINDDGLSGEIERAQARVAKQYEPALYEEMSDSEIAHERELHVWMRARRRRNRKRAFRRDLTAEFRETKQAHRVRLEAQREKRWHDQALAARRRVTDRHARVATLYRRMMKMSRNLTVVLAGGLLLSAVNVGRNYVPDRHLGGPTWWLLWGLSFGVEFLISIPIRELMTLTTTAAGFGRTIDRSKIIQFGGGLLLVTVGLNAGPHLADGDFRRAALYAVAPVAVVACMSMHAWMSNRYAALIEAALAESRTGPDLDALTGMSGEPAGEQESTAAPGACVAQPPAWPGNHPSATMPIPPQPSGWPLTQPRLGQSDVGFLDTAAEAAIQPLPRRPQKTLHGLVESHEPSDQCERIAADMVLRGLSKLDEKDLVAVLRMAEAGENANAIASRLTATTGSTVARSTVDRAISRAQQLGLRPTVTRQGVSHSA